jgi:hypothetical protein
MQMQTKTEQTVAEANSNQPQLDDPLPTRFPVGVVLESRPSSSQWVDQVWTAVAVMVVGEQLQFKRGTPQLIQQSGPVVRYLRTGLWLQLYPDECESYYHNLMSPEPSCYVIAHSEGCDIMPDPFLVSMSYDEAHAYMEGEDDIYAVPIPAELYRWVEAFVLRHYAPEKRVKRKRKNWVEPTAKGSV